MATLSATVTTDPDTFVGEHVFDFGGVAAFYFAAACTALDPDGETIGFESGNIAATRTLGAMHSRDGSEWHAVSGGISQNIQDDAGDVGVAAFRVVGLSARYLKVTFGIVDGSSFATYAGANHPSATFQVDMEYSA